MATNDSRHKSIAFGCAVALVLAAGPLRSVSIGTPVATSCDSLKATALPRTTITSAAIVEAGAFNGTNAGNYDYKTLPAFWA